MDSNTHTFYEDLAYCFEPLLKVRLGRSYVWFSSTGHKSIGPYQPLTITSPVYYGVAGDNSVLEELSRYRIANRFYIPVTMRAIAPEDTPYLDDKHHKQSTKHAGWFRNHDWKDEQSGEPFTYILDLHEADLYKAAATSLKGYTPYFGEIDGFRKELYEIDPELTFGENDYAVATIVNGWISSKLRAILKDKEFISEADAAVFSKIIDKAQKALYAIQHGVTGNRLGRKIYVDLITDAVYKKSVLGIGRYEYKDPATEDWHRII